MIINKDQLLDNINVLNTNVDSLNDITSELKRHIIAKAGSDAIFSDADRINDTISKIKETMTSINNIFNGGK